MSGSLSLRPIPVSTVFWKTISYLANLKALEAWYKHLRRQFFEAQEFGLLIYDGAMEILALALKERLKRLKAMAEKAVSTPSEPVQLAPIDEKKALYEHIDDIEGVFSEKSYDDIVQRNQEIFLQCFVPFGENDVMPYIDAIRKLPPDVSAKGVKWLQSIVDYYCQRISRVLSSTGLFRTI